MPDAWVRRNSRRFGSGPREAGPRPERRRIDRIVVAPIRVPSFRKLALDTDASPPPVLPPQPEDPGADLRVDRGRARLAFPPVGPRPPNQLPVPPEQGLRPDQDQAPPVTRDRSAGRGEHDSVEGPEVQLPTLTAEEPHLVAKDGVLELQGPDRGTAAEPTQRSAHEEIEEEQHPRILEDAGQCANRAFPCPTGHVERIGEVGTPWERMHPEKASTLCCAELLGEDDPSLVDPQGRRSRVCH